MESLGSYLRTQRESQLLSLEDVSTLTKIKVSFLVAIEEDSYDLLPSPFYAKGYLIAYARCLGLDPKDLLLRYANCLKDLMPPRPLALEKVISHHPVKKNRSPLIYILPLLLVLSLYAFLGRSPNQPLSPIEKPAPRFDASPSGLPSPETFDEREVRTKLPEAATQEIPAPRDETKIPVPSGSSSFEVIEAGLGGNVEKEGNFLVLKGKRYEFTSKNERAYFYTKIKAEKKGKIAHTWIYKGKEYRRIEMEVKPPTWSVYSYITLPPGHEGDWATEVKDGDSVINTLSFKVMGSNPSSVR
jgi:transcriptional regulator with XRE-family HTH domain